MRTVTLGRTGITVHKDALGALPLQRASVPDAIKLIQAAVDAGINYIDTARVYSDSEEKLGLALEGRRQSVFIASKTMAATAEGLEKDLETSLKLLKTDCIDVYQLHNPEFVPKPGHELYDALLKVKQAGKIRFTGFTNHRLPVAREAAQSGLYDVLQYPLSYLSDPRELELSHLCAENGVGFVAMKALSGGLITDIGLARRFLNECENVLPIWGLQRMRELEALIKARDTDGDACLSGADHEKIAAERQALGDDFCRGCGYCLPCSEGIQIFNCARTSLLIRRSPSDYWLGDEWRAEMAKIENCRECGSCASRCPYGLNPPALLKKNFADYQTFFQA